MPRRGSDKPTVMLRRERRGFVPCTSFDAEQVDRYAIGSVVEASLHQPRSEKASRLFWVVLGKVLENTEYPTTEALATALKIRLGHVHAVTLIGGGMHFEPKSFRDFDRDEFKQFFDRAMDVLATEVIPGLDIQAVIDEGRP